MVGSGNDSIVTGFVEWAYAEMAQWDVWECFLHIVVFKQSVERNF